MKREFYVERRRVILRTAMESDAIDYVCQQYPNNCQEEQREKERIKLATQLKNVEDGLSVVTVLRKGSKKFIGFIFAKPLDNDEIVFLDLVIPDSNKKLYAVDCIKQFVKTIEENKLCKNIMFFKEYKSSENEEYIEEFLKVYKSRN